MDILRSIQSFINNLSPEDWSVITEVMVATFLLPIIIQVARWVTRIKSENGKFVLALGITMLSGVVAYIHGTPNLGVWFAGAQGAINFVTSQPAYRFGMKQLFAKIKEAWIKELAKAYQVNEQKKAAIPTAENSPSFH